MQETEYALTYTPVAGIPVSRLSTSKLTCDSARCPFPTLNQHLLR